MILRLITTLTLVFASLSTLSACADAEIEQAGAKNSENQRRWFRNGSLLGTEGGIVFGRGQEDAAGGAGLGVNSFLWRETLDTLSFMPLTSADPFGGVIITDWYEDPATPNERFKVNAIILDKSLRADGVKVTLFKQIRQGSNWRDTAIDSNVLKSLEDTILTRARQLKVAQRN